MKFISPVLEVTLSFSDAITLFKLLLPVEPSAVKFLQLSEETVRSPVLRLILTSPRQLTFETVISPVEQERLSEPAVIFSIFIFPVLKEIFTSPDADAKQNTLPVLVEISILSKLKSLCIVTSPVSLLRTSDLYAVSGR